MAKDMAALERLRVRREQLRKETEQSAAEIRKHWETLFTPPPADTKVRRWVSQAERAVAVYDGVMTGYKLMKRLGAAFPRKSRKAGTKRSR